MFCALGTLSVTQSIRGYNGNLLLIPKPNLQERAHHCSFFTVQKLKSVKELNGRVSVRYREESDKSHPWGGFSLGLQKSARSCCSQRLFPICPCYHNSSIVSATLVFIYGIICSAAESITLSFAHLKTHFYNFKV